MNRVFVDQGSSVAIIFLDAFDKLGLKNTDLQMHKEELVGFSGEKVHPKEFVTLHLTLGTRPKTRTVKVDFLVVDGPSAYNVILRRPTLNKIGAVISTVSLTMKFFTDNEEVAIVKADQVAARRCYNANLEIQRQKKEESHDNSRPPNFAKVMMVDLDARKMEGRRPEKGEELEEVQIGKELGQITRINKELPTLLK